MLSYICSSACVNCSRNTLITVKSQQCDIKFLQNLHYISKRQKCTGGQQEAEIQSEHCKTATHVWWYGQTDPEGCWQSHHTASRWPFGSWEYKNITKIRTSVAATSDRRANMRLLSHQTWNSREDGNCSWLASSIHSACESLCFKVREAGPFVYNHHRKKS